MPVIPRTDFDYITTWVAGSSGFVFTGQMALLFNINI